MKMPAEEAAYQERAREAGRIFAALQEKSTCGAYDDSFLFLPVEYQALFPQAENFDIFYARGSVAREACAAPVVVQR